MPNLAPPAIDAECVDCIVVGGGPAGLSAALILGRARRSVIVFDSGEKRNEASLIQHDGFNREQFLTQARDQVLRYPTVQIQEVAVVDIDIHAAHTQRCTPGQVEAGTCDTVLKSGLRGIVTLIDDKSMTRGALPVLEWRFLLQERVTKTWSFEVTTEDGRVWHAKKVILATGVKDLIPELLAPYWGKGVWVCLYCDGYEYSDQPMAAYGNGERGVHIAFEMLLWSKDVTLFTDGEELEATSKEHSLLDCYGIRVVTTKISELYGDSEGELAGVVLNDGRRIPMRAIFFNTGRCQNSELPTKIGLKTDDRGDLICEMRGNVEGCHGLYVAGNCATAPLKLVMTAASQGATTGAKINSELMYEELGLADGVFYKDSERQAIREEPTETNGQQGSCSGMEGGESGLESRGGGSEPQVVSGKEGKVPGPRKQ